MRELTTTRLAEGLGADGSLAFEVLIGIVRDEIERRDNLVNMVHPRHHEIGISGPAARGLLISIVSGTSLTS